MDCQLVRGLSVADRDTVLSEVLVERDGRLDGEGTNGQGNETEETTDQRRVMVNTAGAAIVIIDATNPIVLSSCAAKRLMMFFRQGTITLLDV